MNGIIGAAGPGRAPLGAQVGPTLRATEHPHQPVSDIHARYFGTALNDRTLTAGDGARLGATRFQVWLRHSARPS